jgi:aryl-alcohol dehydrogenase-like predicted oxidoreductase
MPGGGEALSPAASAYADRGGSPGEALWCKGGQLALAWLLKHPAGIEPVIGSTSATRIAAAVEALAIGYRRDDWY